MFFIIAVFVFPTVRSAIPPACLSLGGVCSILYPMSDKKSPYLCWFVRRLWIHADKSRIMMIFSAMIKYFPSRIWIPQLGERIDYILCSPTLCKVAEYHLACAISHHVGILENSMRCVTTRKCIHYEALAFYGRWILCRSVNVCLSSLYTQALHNGLTFLASASEKFAFLQFSLCHLI